MSEDALLVRFAKNILPQRLSIIFCYKIDPKGQSRQVMVSAGLIWHGATVPSFLSKKGLKVQAEQIFPTIKII